MEGEPKAHETLGDKPGSACVQATTGKVKDEVGEATLFGDSRHQGHPKCIQISHRGKGLHENVY